MINQFTLILCLLACSTVWAQNPVIDSKNEGKDFHKRIPYSVEDLLKKNDISAYKAIKGQTRFILVSNYRNGKRWRYFEGDILRFKTQNGEYYDEEVAFIDSTSFTLYKYNNQARRVETHTIQLSDIKCVYKHKKGKIYKVGLISAASFIPITLIDWLQYKNNPADNKDLHVIAPIVVGGNMLIFGGKYLFNKQKMGNNKSIRIINPV